MYCEKGFASLGDKNIHIVEDILGGGEELATKGGIKIKI